MKRSLILILVFLLCGCSSPKEETAPAEEETGTTEDTAVKEEKQDIDIDLSFGSETIAYATVSNILEAPDDYMGQYVKMIGTYRKFHSETYDTDYYVCIVSDATACCSQGLEFRLKEGEEYPLDGQQIILEGTLDVYPEGNSWYVFLNDAAYKVY